MTCNSVYRHMHAGDFSAPCRADGSFRSDGSVPTPMDRGPVLPLRYVSLWQDQPDSALEKRAFRVYLTSASDAEFSIGIRTERSLRCRRVALRAGKRRCIHLPNHGHRWRLELACAHPDAWRPSDGIDVYLDVDWEQ